MVSSIENNFLGFSLHHDFISVVEMEGNRITAIAAKELVQSFHTDALFGSSTFIHNQVRFLDELYKKTSQRIKNVGIVLHSGMTYIKNIPVAMGLETDRLKDQMEWEADQFLIEPLSAYSMEYQKLPFQSQSGNPVYLMVLVRMNLIRKIRLMFEKIGLNLIDVDVDIFSYIRVLLANYDFEPEEISVLIDIQRENLIFVFIRNREYFFSHRVAIPENVSTGDQSKSEIIGSLLIKELRRLAFGYRIGQGIETFHQVFLLGGDIIREISDRISPEISGSLEIVNPFRRVQVSQAVMRSNGYTQYPEKFSASVGIGLKNVQRSQM